MRRAEKAGRESAVKSLANFRVRNVGPALIVRVQLTLDQLPQPHVAYVDTSEFARYIGAHNVTGRAWKEALRAFDRGYRARLQEEIAKLESTLAEKAES